MSIAIPIIISPVCLEDKCYIDGGMISNYPLQYCLDREPKPDITEILGLRNYYSATNINIQSESNILEFLMRVINKLIDQVDTELKQITIPNEVTFSACNMNLQTLSNTLYSSDIRKELYNDGILIGKQFLENKKEFKE